MPFDFELVFTGLCLFTFEGNDRSNPDAVNVLLVKTSQEPSENSGKNLSNAHCGAHPHVPLLSYRARDLTARSSRHHTLVPGPNGEQIGQRNLDGRRIQIAAPRSYLARPSGGGLTARWSPNGLTERRPLCEQDEEWLDWVPALQRVDPHIRAAKDVPLRKSAVTAWVRLTHGTLKAAQVARAINDEYIVWSFREEASPSFDPQESQALAGTVVLELKGLEEPVRIMGLDGRSGFVELAPSAPLRAWQDPGPVQVSITNLPDQEDEDSERLEHFASYYSVVDSCHSTHRLPTASGALNTTTSIFCPPCAHL